MNGARGSGRPELTVLRRLMQFGIGSFLILQERTEQFIKDAVERGQQAQAEGTKLIEERQAKDSEPQQEHVDPLDAQINTTLERLNIPTDQDIQLLNQQIVELANKVDELQPRT